MGSRYDHKATMSEWHTDESALRQRYEEERAAEEVTIVNTLHFPTSMPRKTQQMKCLKYLFACYYDWLTSTEYLFACYYIWLIYRTPENKADLDSGAPKMIWNSEASHTSDHSTRDIATQENSMWPSACSGSDNVLLKGRNSGWGNLRSQLYHARIDRLLDGDYVWAATQTMVSFVTQASWAARWRCWEPP